VVKTVYLQSPARQHTALAAAAEALPEPAGKSRSQTAALLLLLGVVAAGLIGMAMLGVLAGFTRRHDRLGRSARRNGPPLRSDWDRPAAGGRVSPDEGDNASS